MSRRGRLWPLGFALAGCVVIPLPEERDVAAARELLRMSEERLPADVRMEARFLLWRADGNGEDLAESRRLLAHLVDHAPEEYRARMVENVLQHREILAATGR